MHLKCLLNNHDWRLVAGGHRDCARCGKRRLVYDKIHIDIPKWRPVESTVAPNGDDPWTVVVAIIAVLIAAVSINSDSPLAVAVALLIATLAAPVYFLPSIVARARRHHNADAIFVLNLLLGWTLLGWVGALVWSVTATASAAASGGEIKGPK